MTCKHTRIVTYVDVETNQPTSLWACAKCGRRFEPLSYTDYTALLRQALEALENVYGKGKKCEAAITALRNRLGEKA